MNISKHFNRGNFLALSCAALTIGLAVPANAGDFTGPDITVAYADLDIGTEQGASRLLKRLERAASRVCAPLDNGAIGARANATDCRRQLTDAAVRKVDHPMLLAVYKTGHGVTPPVAGVSK